MTFSAMSTAGPSLSRRRPRRLPFPPRRVLGACAQGTTAAVSGWMWARRQSRSGPDSTDGRHFPKAIPGSRAGTEIWTTTKRSWRAPLPPRRARCRERTAWASAQRALFRIRNVLSPLCSPPWTPVRLNGAAAICLCARQRRPAPRASSYATMGTRPPRRRMYCMGKRGFLAFPWAPALPPVLWTAAAG